MIGRRWSVCSGAAILCLVSSGVWADSNQTTLPAGPVLIEAAEPVPPWTEIRLASAAGPVVAQSDGAGRLWSWGTVSIEDGRPRFLPAAVSDEPQGGVRVFQVDAGLLEVRIDGELFTRFHYEAKEPKPFLWPVIGPTGDPVTRAYPMKEIETERRDHRHHRSIWCAWGEVNSDRIEGTTNYWHESKDPANQDRQIVRRIVRTVNGPIFGLIEAHIDWVAHNGQREFSEKRTYMFFRGDDRKRVIDVSNAFAFEDADVTFADTKEAGLLSVRVATSMDEVGLNRREPGQGHMVNSHGSRGEADCWGERADWCDYVGPVNGRTVGIAVFDDPGNWGHPPRWHIRGYGLFSVNNIAERSFLKPPGDATPEQRAAFERTHDAAKTFKKGESAEFNYRILIHSGDTEEARVADAYKRYTLDRPAIVP